MLLMNGCKEINDWRSCKDHYICSPNMCDCQPIKACKID